MALLVLVGCTCACECVSVCSQASRVHRTMTESGEAKGRERERRHWLKPHFSRAPARRDEFGRDSRVHGPPPDDVGGALFVRAGREPQRARDPLPHGREVDRAQAASRRGARVVAGEPLRDVHAHRQELRLPPTFLHVCVCGSVVEERGLLAAAGPRCGRDDATSTRVVRSGARAASTRAPAAGRARIAVEGLPSVCESSICE